MLTRLSVSIEVQDFALLTYRVPADRVRGHLPDVYALQTHEHDGVESCFVTTTCFLNRDFRPTATGYPRHTFFESTYRTYVDYQSLPGVYFVGRYLETRRSYVPQRALARHTYRAEFDVAIDRAEKGYTSYRCDASSPAGDTVFSVTATDDPPAKPPWTTGEEHAQFLTFRPIVVRPFGCPGLCGKFAVIAPAPMFVSSPISASPMYDRCGTFVRSPIAEFLISTKVPAFDSAARAVPGRR